MNQASQTRLRITIVLTLLCTVAASIALAQSPADWIKAFQRNDQAEIQRFFDRREDPNMANEKGYSPLMIAASHGDIETAKKLLQGGAKLDQQDKNGYTPLIWAAVMGKPDMARWLASEGAGLEIREGRGNTALMEAALMDEPKLLDGALQVVARLLEAGANVDSPSANKTTPLIAAAENGHADIARLLIDKGATLDTQNDSGSTALILAAKGGHADVARLLLERGAAVDLQANNQFTPLLMAVSGRHLETTRALLEHRANTELAGPKGITPLMYAAGKGLSKQVQLLLAAGADSNKRSEDGFNALEVAKMSADPNTIALLTGTPPAATEAASTDPDAAVDAKTRAKLQSYRTGTTTYAQFAKDFDLSRDTLRDPQTQPGRISVVSHSVSFTSSDIKAMAALAESRMRGGSPTEMSSSAKATGEYIFGYPTFDGPGRSFASAPQDFHVVARLEFKDSVLTRLQYEGKWIGAEAK